MNFLHLTIPYTSFVQKYTELKEQLVNLKDNISLSNLNDIEIGFKELNNEILNFLEESYIGGENIYYNSYYNTGINEYETPMVQNRQLITQIKKIILDKLDTIEYHLKFLEISDTVKNPSEELYNIRQRFTIRQKKDLILIKLSKFDSAQLHPLSDIYIGNGLKENRQYEIFEIGQELKRLNYVQTVVAGQDNASSAQITISGLEYVEQLNEEAYGIYSIGNELTDKERDNLKNIFADLKEELITEVKEEFKNHKEHLDLSLNALFEVIDESLVLMDSKLPKKTIKQTILGKVIDKGGDKALEWIMGHFWAKFQKKLLGEPDVVDFLTNVGIEDILKIQ